MIRKIRALFACILFSLSAALTGAEVNPPHIILLLHGLAGDTSTWDTFITDLSNGTTVSAPEVYNGSIQESATPISGSVNRQESLFYLYRLRFGAYDASSGLLSVDGRTGTDSTHGDFETLGLLGREVKEAIDAIVVIHPNAEILLVGHSRGGLAARAFLQGTDEQEKLQVVGCITLGTPHQGTYFGRIHDYLSTTPPEDDPDTWALARSLLTLAEVDCFSPSVGFLADNSQSILELNQQIDRLPPAVRYANCTFNGLPLGKLPGAGNIFSRSPLGRLSRQAADYLLGDKKYKRINGDAIVPAKFQSYFKLIPPGSEIGVREYTNRAGVFHTEEPARASFITKVLDQTIGWKISTQ